MNFTGSALVPNTLEYQSRLASRSVTVNERWWTSDTAGAVNSVMTPGSGVGASVMVMVFLSLQLACAAIAARRRTRSVDIDRLQLPVRGKTFGSQFGADTAGLYAAEGPDRIRQVFVDTDGAGMDTSGQLKSALRVAGPDRACEAEVRVVSDVDGLLVVAVSDDRQHRTEDLLLGDRVTVVDIGENGGFDEPSEGAARRSAAAGRDPRTFPDSLGHEALHPFALGGGGHRSDLGGIVQGVADPQRFGEIG